MPDSRLILGTVQLGMPYGIANTHGQPDQATATEIIRTTWAGGVREFDTALGYGASEAVLGTALRALGIADAARVNSKPDHTWDGTDFDALRRDLDASLERLGVPALDGLLLHRENLLDAWSGSLAARFRALKAEGRIRRLGISVYHPEAALRALDIDDFDVVQIPTNLLDRRFERAGLAERATARGKELQIRSIFLQGLVFLDPEALPTGMAFAAETVRALDELTRSLGIDRLHAALGFIRDAWPGCAVLFGAETPAQVRTNLDAFGAPCPQALIPEARRRFADVPETLLNPSLWRG